MKKLLNVALTCGIVLSGLSPVIASTQYYPETVNGQGARIRFSDTAGDLSDAVFDLVARDGEGSYDLGTNYIYGNGVRDESGSNSFENLVIDFKDQFPDKFAFISRNTSNINSTMYDIWAFEDLGSEINDGIFGNLYRKSVNMNSLDTNVGSLSSMFEEALNGESMNDDGISFTKTDKSISIPIFSEIIGASNQQIGDPDLMVEYFNEVYVYLEDHNTKYGFRIDLALGSVGQNASISEVPWAKTQTRGTITRIDFGLPSNTNGVFDYQVNVNGAENLNVEYITRTPVLFLNSEYGDYIDVTVYSRNAEGEKFLGTKAGNVSADLIKINSTLQDIDNSVFRDYITYLYKLGIIDGVGNKFLPKDNVTRGAMAKFIMNAFRLPFNTGGPQFPDVGPNHTFFAYIQSLKNAHIISGMSDGRYRPEDFVDRGSVTKFVVNAARYYDTDAVNESSCSFLDSGSSVFIAFDEYICALAGFGNRNYQKIISGYSSGSYGAVDLLDRGAMAKIILNSAALIPVYSDNPDISFVNSFLDLSEVDYPRPFVAPILVKGFSADFEKDYKTIDLSWLNMNDESVDGFILEKKMEEENDSKYSKLTTGGIPAHVDVDDDLKVYSTQGGEIGNTYEIEFLRTTVSTGATIELSEDEGLITVKLLNTGSVNITKDSVVKAINGDTVTQSGVSVDEQDDLFEIIHAQTSHAGDVMTYSGKLRFSGGKNFIEGVVLLDNLDDYMKVTDNEYRLNQNYVYRMSAFKFIPYEFAEESYTSQSNMEYEENYDVRSNMIISGWQTVKIKASD